MGNEVITIMLSELPEGKRAKVCRVNAGIEAKQRLANLGMLPGIEILKRRSAPFHGPIEIEVRGSILALGRGIADKIVVEMVRV